MKKMLYNFLFNLFSPSVEGLDLGAILMLSYCFPKALE